MARTDYRRIIERHALLVRLAAFDPHVAGTPPLGLDLPSSDIDILCHAPDLEAFAAATRGAFGHSPQFELGTWAGPPRAVIASFLADDWRVEVFGATCPVAEQAGWRHFEVERRLLALGGPAFRAAIMEARRGGLKTEPAFAERLGLAGDPFAALLEIETRPDTALLCVLARAGFAD